MSAVIEEAPASLAQLHNTQVKTGEPGFYLLST